MIDRLKLLKKAGGYYHLPYYQAKKDKQVAALVHSGAKLQEMTRGTVDLSRMMNRVSQETNFTQRKKRRKNWQGEFKADNDDVEAESNKFDFRVLDSVRQTPEFQTLQSRFLAVFTWPSLLSAIYPPFQRQEYREKAGGQSYLRTEEGPSFQNVRKKLPLLKTKAFYRYANKTKEQKEELERKKEERRILLQVKQLLADENDPDPEVFYEPNSESENEASQQEPGSGPEQSQPPSPSSSSSNNKRSREEEEEGGEDVNAAAPHKMKQEKVLTLLPPKKKLRRTYKKRDPNARPVRQSERVTERRVYTDSINQKRSLVPRKKRGEGAAARSLPPLQQQCKVRPNLLHRNVRMAMIDAIVENSRKPLRKHGTKLGQWNLGGYMSDDDDDNDNDGDNRRDNDDDGGDRGHDLESELRQRGEWVGELPSELRDNLALLERESIVEAENSMGGGGGNSGKNNNSASTSNNHSSSSRESASSSAVAVTATLSSSLSSMPSSSSACGEVAAQIQSGSGGSGIGGGGEGGGSHVTGFSQSTMSLKRFVPEVIVLESDDDDDDDDGGSDGDDDMDDDDDDDGPTVASLLEAKRAGK